MRKTWLFNFICVLMISLPLHGMSFVVNMSPDTRLMRNIRNASEFLNKKCRENGWAMFITGTAVATLCCYDKPVLWHAGVVGFNGLLMYKFIQMQKQMNALAKQLEEANDKTMEQNGIFQRNLDKIQEEQKNQQGALQETDTKINGFLPKLDAHAVAITEKLAAFDKENIDPLRGDVKIASDKLDKISESIVTQGEQQAALGKNISDVHALITNLRQKQEAIVAEHTKRFDAIDEKFETRFNELNASIATSFGEIKEHLSKKGIAWQGNKQIGFGRQAAGGLISPLSSVIKLHSSNTSTP